MSKKLQLSIPEPCHENWDNMTPVQQGKFCDSCQKQVVDFINMTDRQLAEFFKKPSTGSVCGRFMTDQLDRNIEIPKKRIPWLKYFFQFAIPAFLVSLKSSGQNPKEVIATSQSIDILKGKIQEPIITPTIAPVKIAELVKADTSIYKEKKETDTNCALKVRGNVSIRIGGVVSVKTNDEPLIVVDGVPQIISPLVKVDPKTIDSVIILKGSVATAMYGSKGINGAILITTKKIGKIEPFIIKEETPKISGVKVYPNPFQAGDMLSLLFNDDDKKEAIVRILNPDGKLLLQQRVNTKEGNNIFQLPTDTRWAAGLYFVQLLYENGKVLASEKIIIH